jgi:hypothetical protein
MSGPSKVIVLDPDERAARQVQLGFSREGVPAAIGVVNGARPDLPSDGAALVVVGGADGRALELLRKTRLVLDEKKLDVPIIFSGRGIRRTDAEAAGADEVVLHPAFLRDVVTIGRLLRGQPADKRAHLVGSLAETTGVFTLVRALSALGRSAVLTLIRGLRRGEIRFFHGEVTSAQVGLIHGQAAFHQLLLWTEARFEFHHEDVVRRQQIPMSPEELFADAERFLEGVRDASGQLSPSMVLEQDMLRISALGKQVPTEVHGVLRMFDGNRVLADVLEDSPYRVFETLRVAQRACDVGLLRVVERNRPKATWRAVLAIEEWLVGSDRDAVIQRAQSAADSQPVAAPRDSSQRLKGKRRRKKHRAQTPAPVAPVATSKPDIDWGALVPRVVGAEVGSLSGVVPAAHTSGEIQLPPTRSAERERLEALMDTEKRERIFSKDVGLEPKVVLEQAEEPKPDVDAKAKADAEAAAKAKADAEAASKAKADAEAAAKAKADADAKSKAEADAAKLRAQAEAKAAAEEAKLRGEAADLAKQLAAKRAAEAEQKEREAAELTKRLADAKAKIEAERPALDETAARPLLDDSAERRLIDGTGPMPKTEAEEEAMWRAAKAKADEADKRTAVAPGVTTSENPNAVVVVHEHITVDTTVNTARVSSESVASITSSAPEALDDEPSDGVVRQLTTVETAPVRRPPPPNEIPPDDRPEARKGEIQGRPKIPTAPPMGSEPSILVADIAAAQSAVSAVVAQQAAAAPSKDIAAPAREAAVAEVRKDAVQTFSDAEEEFFKAGQGNTGKVPTFSPTETFDDLDEGYQPVGFWDRLRGKKPPK